MIYHRYNDITKCRLFISTFKAYSRTWFSSLPLRSVGSWEEFKAVFLAKFRVNTPHVVHTISLKNVKQNPKKYLRDYIEKFKTSTFKVRELRPAKGVDSFIHIMNYQVTRNLLTCTELITLLPHTSLGMKGLWLITPVLEMKHLVLDAKLCRLMV